MNIPRVLYVWILALRLRTLSLSFSCVAMAAFIARARHAFRYDIFFWTLITACLLQILSNFANDYGDGVTGVDNNQKPGPKRAVQTGLISKQSMKIAIVAIAVLSFTSGLFLIRLSLSSSPYALLVFMLVGIVCIAAAIMYTVGRRPYGYFGLGDLAVFIFFGLVGVAGTLYLFLHKLYIIDLLPSMSCGLFAVAVLNINNIRDADSDRLSGKYSFPIYFGKKKAIQYHWLLLLTGLTNTTVYMYLLGYSLRYWLFLFVTPLFIMHGIAVARRPAHKLDSLLGQMTVIMLLFVISFGLGIISSSYYEVLPNTLNCHINFLELTFNLMLDS